MARQLPLWSALCGLLIFHAACFAGPDPGAAPRWRYELLAPSTTMLDCPICGRPAVPTSARGSFELGIIEENPLLRRYAISNLTISGYLPGDSSFLLVGTGLYEVGGEVALRQSMFLDLELRRTDRTNRVLMTTSTPDVARTWPVLQASLVQTNGTMTELFYLDFLAAPIRDIWFSLTNKITPTRGASIGKAVSAGSLLSRDGSVLRANADLLAAFKPSNPNVDAGLDAIHFAAGGVALFSTDIDVPTLSQGALHHGDVLSERGAVLYRYENLVGPFGMEPPLIDVGLDALHIDAAGNLFFSIRQGFFSENQGRMIGRGDLLGPAGLVRKTNAELLARFHTPDARHDYGLDAIYLVPGSGEVWFSVEESFADSMLGTVIQPGDLLSEQGYIVFRNMDLLRNFMPAEQYADFGLDALTVISDAAEGVSLPQPQMGKVAFTQSTRLLQLFWEGGGQAFQLERADVITGPFNPVTGVMPATNIFQLGIQAQRGFFRVRQW